VVTGSAEPPTAGAIRLVAFASLIGTTIEWYDFFLYGTAAATVFNRLYFPTFDPLAGTLAAFGTYTVGFVARPIGGIVIGHYGDRIGRKSMLVLTLTIMGVATFGIGLLPTYAQAGPWAAVALVALRLAQGFGVGGEWGGAVLMAVEHTPPGARGFYGSWPQIGVPAGLLVSTAVFAQFARLPEDQFLSWGWRVPFLLSIVLVAVGLIIRLRILETPAFTRLKDEQVESRRPALELLMTHRREVLLAIGARFAENGAFYIYTVFMLVYGTQKVGLDRQSVLNGILLAAACGMIAIPICGALSDRIGRRRSTCSAPARRRSGPTRCSGCSRDGHPHAGRVAGILYLVTLLPGCGYFRTTDPLCVMRIVSTIGWWLSFCDEQPARTHRESIAGPHRLCGLITVPSSATSPGTSPSLRL
jgi:MFS family permease